MKARKMLWRPLAILMIVCMLTQTVGAVGVEEESNNPEYIIVDGRVNTEKSQLIIDAISGEGVDTTRNILCLFGHNTARTTTREIIHRQYATAPRCHENTYDVTYCTRSGCNYISYTLTGSARIYCCS